MASAKSLSDTQAVAATQTDRSGWLASFFMPRWKPHGSAALVTGASSGIGRELVRRLVRDGCRCIATARRSDRLEELAGECAGASGEVIPLPGDITDESHRQRLTREVERRFARLDLLVNNAGIGAIGPFADASPSRLRTVMEVNFFAPAELTRLMLPLLAAGRAPVICNIGSVLGHRAVPDKSEYCASKFALHGWSDALRAELAGDGIEVTLVSPSTTSSEFFDAVIETQKGRASRSFGSMRPETVALQTYRAIRARRHEVILSPGGKALVWLDRLCPPLMNRILSRDDAGLAD